MGGLLILTAILVPSLLWCNLTNRYVQIALISTVWTGAIGFIDDYLRVVKRRPKGLVGRYKLVGQMTLGLGLGAYLYFNPLGARRRTLTSIPFAKGLFINFGPLFVLLVALVVTGASNAVNLSDGIDGLAIGLSAFSFLAFAGLSYLSRSPRLLRLSEHHVSRGQRRARCVLHVGCRRRRSGSCGTTRTPRRCSWATRVRWRWAGRSASSRCCSSASSLLGHHRRLVRGGGLERHDSGHVVQADAASACSRWRRFTTTSSCSGWHENQVVVRFWIVGALLVLLSLSTLKLQSETMKKPFAQYRRNLFVLGMARERPGRERCCLRATTSVVSVFDDDATVLSKVLAADAARSTVTESQWSSRTRAAEAAIAACDCVVVEPRRSARAPALVSVRIRAGEARDRRDRGRVPLHPRAHRRRHRHQRQVDDVSVSSADILKAGGIDAVVAGNIGTPVCDVLRERDPHTLVLELSSFQLDTTDEFRVDVAVLLNVTPDHLDRYHHSLRRVRRLEGAHSASRHRQHLLRLQPRRHAAGRLGWKSRSPRGHSVQFARVLGGGRVLRRRIHRTRAEWQARARADAQRIHARGCTICENALASVACRDGVGRAARGDVRALRIVPPAPAPHGAWCAC